MNDIEILETMLKIRKEQKEIIECANEYRNCKDDIQALEHAITALKERQADKDRIKKLEKNDETERLIHYKNGFYAGYDNVKKQMKDTKDYLKIKYQETSEKNPIEGFKLKCQISILQELLRESD